MMPQLQMLAVSCLFFSRHFREGSTGRPTAKSVSLKALLPDTFAIECGPCFAETVWKHTAMESCAGPGELRPCVQVAGVAFKLLPKPSFWQDQRLECSTLWNPTVGSGTHTFRYYTLDAAVKGICPEFGMAAFVAVRNKPSLLGALPEFDPAADSEEFVMLAAPLGLILDSENDGGFQKNTLVAVINEQSGFFGVTGLGVKRIVQVPKNKLIVAFPLQLEYQFYRDRAYLQFRRFVLDHYAFYE
jgi:hypothetical protein